MIIKWPIGLRFKRLVFAGRLSKTYLMTRSYVNLSSLEVFAEAGRTGSFKTAASNLFISPSAVSQSIRKLEERINCALFIRSGNALQLTAEGKQLLFYVESGLSEIREGLSRITADAQQPLSISSPPGIAAHLLPPVIQGMMSLGIKDIRLLADEAPDFKSYKKFDAAILYGDKASRLEGLESLGPDVFMPICNQGIADQLGSIDDILKFPLIVNETNAVAWEEWFKLNKIEKRASQRLRFNRGVQIIAALRDGLGIGLEPMRIVAHHLESGELVQYALSDARPVIRHLTFLYVGKDPVKQPFIDQLADLIRFECATGDNGQRINRKN